MSAMNELIEAYKCVKICPKSMETPKIQTTSEKFSFFKSLLAGAN